MSVLVYSFARVKLNNRCLDERRKKENIIRTAHSQARWIDQVDNQINDSHDTCDQPRLNRRSDNPIDQFVRALETRLVLPQIPHQDGSDGEISHARRDEPHDHNRLEFLELCEGAGGQARRGCCDGPANTCQG